MNQPVVVWPRFTQHCERKADNFNPGRDEPQLRGNLEVKETVGSQWEGIAIEQQPEQNGVKQEHGQCLTTRLQRKD